VKEADRTLEGGKPSVGQTLAVLTHPMHFIGVGGYGMSGLAMVLHQMGYPVSGCDVRASSRTRWLESAGVAVSIGHDPDHLVSCGAVVVSTDVPAEHPELREAGRRGLPVYHRADVLAWLIGAQRSVAVTGTHGKTTTTGLIGSIARCAGLEPTILVGGETGNGGGTALMGGGKLLIAEACESDGTFTSYRPHIAVVTSLEPEHLEFYQNDFEQLREAMKTFIGQVDPQGAVVLCHDDPNLRNLDFDTRARVVWYGAEPGPLGESGPSVWAENENLSGEGVQFDLVRPGGRVDGVALPLFGRHNLLNSLAAAACASELGVDGEDIRAGLMGFPGTRRRFELVARLEGITIVDDYAHHPTEIRATLEAARQVAGGRIIVIFQPQRYTRTHLLMDEFARAFHDADLLILMDIYAPPGQDPIPGVSSEVLADRIRAARGPDPILLNDHRAIARFSASSARPGDLVITMGAGDVWRAGRLLAECLSPH